jgi:CubicO group peptidase (beta-lactamase class C family)
LDCRRGAAAVLAALLLLSPVNLAADQPPPEIQKVEKGLRGPVLLKGDKTWTIEERMRQYRVPAVSIAVFGSGRILWAKAYGLADADAMTPATEATLFQAASVSKPVSAMAVLKKVEQGKLSLEKNVNDYLKSWKMPENEWTRKNPVTLAGLLSHSAGVTVHGFPGYAAGRAVPTLAQVLEGAPPANTAPIRQGVSVFGRRVHDRAAGLDRRRGQALPADPGGNGSQAARDEGEHLRAASPRGIAQIRGRRA